MTLQTVKVRLPDVLYQQIERRARRLHRSVEDELVAVVSATLPTLDDLPSDIADDVAQLAFLTDDELWRTARATLTPDESERMQALLLKRQREGLTSSERQEAEHLLHRYDRTMLIRAQAAVLLKERGHDVSPLQEPLSDA
jgi:plasmid stability protein